MSYYLTIFVLSLMVACWPFRASILGRALGAISAISSWTYFSSLATGKPPRGVGNLANWVNLDPSWTTAEGITSLLMLVLAFYTLIVGGAGSRTLTAAKITTPTWASIALVAICSILAVYILMTLDPAELLSYTGYGSIKGGEQIGGDDALGRTVGNAFRFLAIILIGISTLELFSGKLWVFALALPANTIAIGLSMAEASRIFGVYLVVIAICALLMKRPVIASIAVLTAFLGIAYSLEARGHSQLGLLYLPDYVAQSLTRSGLVDEVLSNVSMGNLITSASIKAGIAERYDELFKILSFLPSVDAIDGFQAAKQLSEQRIYTYIPFNAFAEAWLFGPAYYALLWIIIFWAARSVNCAARFGIVWFMCLSAVYLLALVFTSQYPVRNSVRYYYFIILAELLIPSLRALQDFFSVKNVEPSEIQQSELP